MNNSIIESKQFNIGYISTDLQCIKGRADKIALNFFSPSLAQQLFTFNDMRVLSNRFSNILSNYGFYPGDIFFLYLPKSPELFISILGMLKSQIVAGCLFANIGEDSFIDRMNDAKAKGIIIKKSFLKKINQLKEKLPFLKKVIVIDIDQHITDDVLSYAKLMNEASPDFITAPTNPEQSSVLHYTSGSTGKPKGVLHTHGGITYQNKTFNEIFQAEENDIFWCTADQGWVTGTTYGVTAPWSAGITQIHYSGSYDPETWFNILQNQRVNIWYTAPTALRMMMREEDDFYKKFDLSALKYIFSVGEPLNPEVIKWGKKVHGKNIYDTWFQTETGAIMIANKPGQIIIPGSMGKPVDGIEAAIIDDSGNIAENNKSGNLCIKSGWESMFRTYLNNEQIYNSKFKNGYYYSGDKAYKDNDGYFWFLGRSDDVINTAGHLVSPFELESALMEIDEVAEAAVIGAPDDILFEKVVAFICLHKNIVQTPEIELKIRLYITKKVSSVATPQVIIFKENIPKNKSGKIMRRVLKAEYLGENPGDKSTMEV